MKKRLRTLTMLLLSFAPIIARAQSSEPQLIDEFGKLNSEEAVVRLQSAMIKLADRLADHPSSLLQFVNFRSQNQSIGEPYRTFGTQKAFFAAEHYDTSRIVSTICEASPRPYTQIWLIDSLAQRHECRSDDIPINTATLFVTSTAPNDKYEMGSCCMIDEVRYPASMETVNAFAQFVDARSGATAYVVVYGGTNVFRYRDSNNGPEKVERHLDPPSFVAKLGNDVRQRLLASGLDRSRFILLNGGYRDQYATIDLWIVPPGRKRPEPSPNYFRSSRPATKSHRHGKR